MATFHIGHQSGYIQNADTINNGIFNPITNQQLATQLERLVEELNRTVDAGFLDITRAHQVHNEIIGATNEASLTNPQSGRIRASLVRAAGILSDISAASTLASTLHTLISSLPIG